jgi:hypothetical protein
MDPLGQVAVELDHAAVLKMTRAWRSSDATTSTCAPSTRSAGSP